MPIILAVGVGVIIGGAISLLFYFREVRTFAVNTDLLTLAVDASAPIVAALVYKPRWTSTWDIVPGTIFFERTNDHIRFLPNDFNSAGYSATSFVTQIVGRETAGTAIVKIYGSAATGERHLPRWVTVD